MMATLNNEDKLDAGRFAPWLASMSDALRGQHGSDVPCQECTACCTSFQFVHIGPDEQDTLAAIPGRLLFPAPKLPRGHVLIGYDKRGRCPMLVDNRCSIYEHRPRACRLYDCRVFSACGIAVEGRGKELIARRVRRWEFQLSSREDETALASVRSAVKYLAENRAELDDRFATITPAQQALLAIEVHELFLDRQTEGHSRTTPRYLDAVRAELAKKRAQQAPDWC